LKIHLIKIKQIILITPRTLVSLEFKVYREEHYYLIESDGIIISIAW
jgi:hypothetical protein